jgi:rubrerythrin
MPSGLQGTAIATEEELMALAVALEAEAAQRYRDLADWAEARDEPELVALFNELSAMEAEHEATVQSASRHRLGHEVAPTRLSSQVLSQFNDPTLRSALLTRYRALSIAVRSEERAFAFYAEVAAYATTPSVRAMAEELARAELEHAAVLRVARRAAYRSEPSKRQAEPPADLQALERQSAAWEAEVGNAATRTARLLALSRNVERYLEIAELTTNEQVLNTAQDHAAQTLRHLVRAREST